MFLIFVFRQDNQPCDNMEQTDTISCVSSNQRDYTSVCSGTKMVSVLIVFQRSLLNLIELQAQKVHLTKSVCLFYFPSFVLFISNSIYTLSWIINFLFCFHSLHSCFVSLISLFSFLQDSTSCRCDQNANTSKTNRNHLSPCQPNSGHKPHLQLFPDSQWEGRI